MPVSDSNNCSVIDSVYVGAVSLGNIEHEDVLIYPNPTINTISVHGLSNFNYSVTDFNGKIILRGNTIGDVFTTLITLHVPGVLKVECRGKFNPFSL